MIREARVSKTMRHVLQMTGAPFCRNPALSGNGRMKPTGYRLARSKPDGVTIRHIRRALRL
jgi:hypothetical protein